MQHRSLPDNPRVSRHQWTVPLPEGQHLAYRYRIGGFARDLGQDWQGQRLQRGSPKLDSEHPMNCKYNTCKIP
jgi:hypothetical protein